MRTGLAEEAHHGLGFDYAADKDEGDFKQIPRNKAVKDDKSKRNPHPRVMRVTAEPKIGVGVLI